MSWADHIEDYIQFESPEYNVFNAKWIKNDRSFEKKLGIFEPPNFKGAVVQDLDVKATYYPLTVYFDGTAPLTLSSFIPGTAQDNFKQADAFWKSLNSESGSWTVTHPTKGTLILQLVSCKESVNPVENGNFTVFDTNWIEASAYKPLFSGPASLADTLSSALDTISDAANQMAQLKADLYSAVISALAMVTKISGFVTQLTSTLSALDQTINDLENAAQTTLANVMADFAADPSDHDNISALADALNTVIVTPIQATSDYTDRYTAYTNLISSFATAAPIASTGQTTIVNDIESNYNSAIMLEAGIISALIALAQIVVTSTYKTRADVLTAMDNLTDSFNDTIAILENVQTLFQGNEIDQQYFSQTQSYTNLQKTFTSAMQYLLNMFFTLGSVKTFTLKKARSPIEITVTEYGSLGTNDANYDLFISSNNLNGQDVLLLPAGREVVIYVDQAS